MRSEGISRGGKLTFNVEQEMANALPRQVTTSLPFAYVMV
jgi:hypothetical protein